MAFALERRKSFDLLQETQIIREYSIFPYALKLERIYFYIYDETNVLFYVTSGRIFGNVLVILHLFRDTVLVTKCCQTTMIRIELFS